MLRRQFIKTIGTSSILLSVGVISCRKNDRKNKVLILGGTNFVGPSIVQANIDAGNDVTLFNRGITNPGLFPELRLIKGDREKGISCYDSLKSDYWDLVIDVWPEKAQLVEEATESLRDHAGHYIFISSIAVYNDFQEVGLHEESELVDLPDDRSQWYYSEEKLAAEKIIRERFPDNHTILRAGPIKGWRDPAVDLLYWCLRLKEHSEVLAPGSGDDPIQFIDVKDIGRFSSFAFANGISGTFNITGPLSSTLTWRQFLRDVKSHFNSESELIWASEDFLKENKVMSFTDLPLWAPLSEDRGFMQISNQKLINTEFELSPITSTLEDVMQWYNKELPSNIAFGSEEIGIGLTRSKELKCINLIRK
ncbi:MAG: NAD-dependent epimerase/dehydratase family protein [Saprospiraceae bacterium]|nr:NAD-dependent epimerase/dehydratase family protein [Saprospiraceae bacterium]